MGAALALGVSVAVAPYREQARIVLVALLHQYVQRPFLAFHNRETRCAEPDYFASGDLLEGMLGSPDRLAKLRSRKLRHSAVIMAVRGYLMSAGGDATHEVTMSLGDPAKHEEGGRRAVPFEETEELIDRCLDSALPPIPRLSGHVRLQGRDVEVLLYVDGEMMSDW